MNASIVHGFNFDLNGEEDLKVPIRVKSIGYGSGMVQNVNFMLGLILLEVTVAAVIFAVGKVFPSFAATSEKITSLMLKKYLLALVLFNTLNISYCAGLQFMYGDINDPLYVLDVVIAVVSLALPLLMLGFLAFSDKTHFGEFTKDLRANGTAKIFFFACILYKMVLGLLMSTQNESEEGTILAVFLTMLFVLYATANKPFLRVRENYRTAVVHIGELTVLSVAMYYRSMKSNTPVAERSQILAPATLELATICLVLVASAVTVGY